MDTRQVDIAIIGAGTAGLNARREAEKAGKDWVLIESGPYGTTCARVGCMPSKLLIAAADNAHEVDRSDTFGIRVPDGDWHVDGPAVMERVRRERDRFVGFVVDATEEIPEEKRIRGHAEFTGPRTLEIDGDRRIEADSIVIATGSSPWIPPSLDDVREDVLVNDDIFEFERLPDSLAVFGTGVVGLELGQALQRLGVEVAFFNPYDDLGLLSDPIVDGKAHDVFQNRLTMHLESDVHQIDRVDDGYRLHWFDHDGGEHESVFEEILSAAGRRPNLGDLNLEATGLKLDARGVPADIDYQTMQCGDSPIFIAGDAAGHRMVLHEASDEGRIAGANAARYPNIDAARRRTQLAIVFTDPQMAVVGKRWQDLPEDAAAVGEVSYDDQGRARVMGVNSGHVRLYGWKDSCTFAGAEMIGPGVEHTSHLLAWAAQRKMDVHEILELPFYHPVLEEGIRTGLRDLAKALRIEGRCRPEDNSIGPGA